MILQSRFPWRVGRVQVERQAWVGFVAIAIEVDTNWSIAMNMVEKEWTSKKVPEEILAPIRQAKSVVGLFGI